MRLLVSVTGRQEVHAAVSGGADVVDVKDPSRGPLGAPDLSDVRAVRAVVEPPRLLSVAIGDASEGPSVILARARAVAASGVEFVKLALHEVDGPAERVLRRVVLAVDAVDPAVGVVCVGYADDLREGCLTLPERARNAGAHAVMMDTCRKDGKSLLDHVQEDRIARFVALGHQSDLLVGLAGSLGRAELIRLRGCGADVVGVRGAACRGGRSGRISAGRVRDLAQAIRLQPSAPGTTISRSKPAAASSK
jgi:uncharacterized protein (UPF0264 family)